MATAENSATISCSLTVTCTMCVAASPTNVAKHSQDKLHMPLCSCSTRCGCMVVLVRCTLSSCSELKACKFAHGTVFMAAGT